MKLPQPNRSSRTLLRPQNRTNPLIWLAAILCLVLALALILSLALALAAFLLVKPRNPSFDTPAASLNAVYLDSPSYLNADLSVLLNFSNPNSRIDFFFERAGVELFFGDRMVASRTLQPFAQRGGGGRLEAVRMVSSGVYLPPEVAAEIAGQVRGGRVLGFSVRGRFRVRARFGVGHFSYWLYGRCRIVMTGPPRGVLVERSCGMRR